MNIVLSICIPTYNRCDRLHKTLKNLLRIIEKIDNKAIEIIVSDNNSIDETPVIINDYRTKINYYRQTSNLGYDGNIKFLYSVAKGKYIFLLADDDEIIDEKFVELYDIIYHNKNSNIECFLINYFEGDNQIDKFEYIDHGTLTLTMNELELNFHNPFVFLSGFVLKNKKTNLNKIDTGTYFAQMDIALLTLCESSKLYIYRDYVVRRIIPHYKDETGCNIIDDTWKIYLGSAKIIRKYERKFNARSSYFLEIYRLASFSKNYIKLPNRSLNKKINVILFAFSKLQFKYKIRVIFLPILVLKKIWHKIYKSIKLK